MGVRNFWRREAAPDTYPTVPLSEALNDEYDILGQVDNDVYGSVVLVAPRPPVLVAPANEVKSLRTYGDADLRELGSTAPSPYTAWLHREYNNTLRDRQGLLKYDEMRRSDGTVRGSLRLLKTPVLSARWFMAPADDSAKNKKIADFVWWNLTKGMTSSWPQMLNEILLMLDYGFYAFEKVFTNTHPHMPGKVCWQKFGPRHPLEIQQWKLDENGGPLAIEMYNPAVTTPSKRVEIPIEKLAVFTFDKEAGDMRGLSVLRSAYKHWYYKSQLEKIDAIQKERHGIGVPIIKLPINFNNDDKKYAENLGRNLRSNDKAHIVLPPGWEIIFAKLEGQHVDALASVSHHDMQIQKNILAPFMDGGAKEADQDLFLKSSRYIAEIVCDVFNKYCIPQLVAYNWANVTEFPELKVRRIGEQGDWRTMSFALRNLVGAGVVLPDDELEKNVREEMDLPPRDPKTVRVVATPQNQTDNRPQTDANGNPVQPGAKSVPEPGPGGAGPKAPAPPRVGPPRQSKPGVKPTNANAGGDRSGG
jgi:hypothetical protein